MDYRLKVGEEICSVKVMRADDTGARLIRWDGEECRATITRISDNHLHVALGRDSANLFVAGSEEGTWVWSAGRARLVQDADKVERRKSRGPAAESPGEITPPTPATVVRIMVAPGDKVDVRQPVIVVSAMKMELTLSAPYAGTVTSVNTEVGARVSPGQILVDIEAFPEENQDG